MEILSPKSANLPVKPKEAAKRMGKDVKQRAAEKPVNPDKIDDKWRPPSTVSEPGDLPEAYLVGRKLGKGGFAVCFEGRTQSNGELFALKVVKAEIQQKKMLEKFRTEMQIHAKMRHPNIVEFMRAFTVDSHTYVVLELCNNGSLADMVKARTCLSLPEVRRYMIQICGGVKYIHKRNVIHRDLKMGNVFIDSKMNLKIGDFGLAAVMADEQDRRTTLCGTPNYIAPEILSKSGTRGHDCKVDTWAIGVICYAMLTGRPPFQSSTQQEIYNKLRTLEYEWKIDSPNYIPQEAKDCVASCLTLTAAERPDMDELVDQDFFKMGCVADELDVSCLKEEPTWLQAADPRGDRVSTGYGVDHGRLCSECGVGKTADGRMRPAVGGNAKISALVEIEVENRQGCAPVTPLPEGVLYKQFREVQAEWSMTQKHPLSARPRSRKPVEESTVPTGLVAKIADDMRNDRPAPSKMLPPPTMSSARPVQSFAAQQRQQALPRTTTGRAAAVNKDSLDLNSTNAVEEKPTENQGLLKARPVRAGTVRATRAAQAREISLAKSSTLADRTDNVSDRLIRETDEVEARPPSRSFSTLPTRSRSLRSQNEQTTKVQASVTHRVAETMATPLNSITGNAREDRGSAKRAVPSFEEIENRESVSSNDFELPKHKSSFKPRLIEASEPYTLVPASSHAKVMKSLRQFHHALGQTTSRSAATTTATMRTSSTQITYPRVDKWVDYATKHGIAYILTDGSLGMILKSKEADGAASSCIVVRKARRHTVLRARGVEHQFVTQGTNVADVEFYEQTDAAFAMKRFDVPSAKFELDLKTHSTQTAAATTLLNKYRGSSAHRVKEVGLLDKFGKYMNKQMGASDISNDPESAIGKQKSNFIHFFQRMGNVGVWRFADGGLQFNFPDHTKIIVHQSDPSTSPSALLNANKDEIEDETEVMIDMVYLDPRDATDLATYNALTNDALERRGLRAFTLSSIISNSLRRSELEIIRTNQVKEKLSWIRAVIGLWIREGGLGWTGEERLGWSGMSEVRSDRKVKLQWVTVGRPGGDGDVSAEVVAGA